MVGKDIPHFIPPQGLTDGTLLKTVAVSLPRGPGAPINSRAFIINADGGKQNHATVCSQVMLSRTTSQLQPSGLRALAPDRLLLIAGWPLLPRPPSLSVPCAAKMAPKSGV